MIKPTIKRDINPTQQNYIGKVVRHYKSTELLRNITPKQQISPNLKERLKFSPFIETENCLHLSDKFNHIMSHSHQRTQNQNDQNTNSDIINERYSYLGYIPEGHYSDNSYHPAGEARRKILKKKKGPHHISGYQSDVTPSSYSNVNQYYLNQNLNHHNFNDSYNSSSEYGRAINTNQLVRSRHFRDLNSDKIVIKPGSRFNSTTRSTNSSTTKKLLHSPYLKDNQYMSMMKRLPLKSHSSSKSNTSSLAKSRRIVTSNINSTSKDISDLYSNSADSASQAQYFKSKTITIVHGTLEQKRKRLDIFITRKSVKNLDQFVIDVSESLGLPQWKNDRIRQLYTIRGKKVVRIRDLFENREGVFVAMGREILNVNILNHVIHDLEYDNTTSTNQNLSGFNISTEPPPKLLTDGQGNIFASQEWLNENNRDNLDNVYPGQQEIPKIVNAPSTIMTNTSIGRLPNNLAASNAGLVGQYDSGLEGESANQQKPNLSIIPPTPSEPNSSVNEIDKRLQAVMEKGFLKNQPLSPPRTNQTRPRIASESSTNYEERIPVRRNKIDSVTNKRAYRLNVRPSDNSTSRGSTKSKQRKGQVTPIKIVSPRQSVIIQTPRGEEIRELEIEEESDMKFSPTRQAPVAPVPLPQPSVFSPNQTNSMKVQHVDQPVPHVRTITSPTVPDLTTVVSPLILKEPLENLEKKVQQLEAENKKQQNELKLQLEKYKQEAEQNAACKVKEIGNQIEQKVSVIAKSSDLESTQQLETRKLLEQALKKSQNEQSVILNELNDHKLYLKDRLESNLVKTKQSAASELVHFKKEVEKELEGNKQKLDSERKLLEKERNILKEERLKIIETRKQWQAEDLARKKRDEDTRLKTEWEKLEKERKRVDDEWKKWEKEKLKFIDELQVKAREAKKSESERESVSLSNKSQSVSISSGRKSPLLSFMQSSKGKNTADTMHTKSPSPTKYHQRVLTPIPTDTERSQTKTPEDSPMASPKLPLSPELNNHKNFEVQKLSKIEHLNSEFQPPPTNHQILQTQKTDDADTFHKKPKYNMPARKIITVAEVQSRYDMYDQIGEGNFADVYVCKLVNTESQFAMKIMDKVKLGNQKNKKILENEISIMGVCHHENIVRLRFRAT